MAKKLFVGGLSWNTTSEQLKAAFETIGPVTDAVVITDRETGRSRGFGFVTYASDADGDRALTDLSGTMLDGRAIKVDAATERAPGGMGGGGPRSFGPPRRPMGAPPPSFDRGPASGGPPRTGGGGGGGGGGGPGPSRRKSYENKDRRERDGMRKQKREDEAPKAGDYVDDEY